MSQPRIALVGNLGNVAYQMCKFLRRRGVQADVFVASSELATGGSPELHDPGVLADPPEWLKIMSEPWPTAGVGVWTQALLRKGYHSFRWRLFQCRFISWLRQYDLIESFCLQPFWLRRIGRPYISFATGSDLRELAMENGQAGRIARDIFQNAQIVFFGPDPGHLNCVRQLRLSSSYPYRQIIDADFYAPDDPWHRHADRKELVIFHPTRLDWAYRGSDRLLKGNDKLFCAFARLVKEGHPARLIYLERGSDVVQTRQLVRELEIEPFVEVPSAGLTAPELRDYYNRADVVADQFNGGGFGLIGLEAMSCSRPTLVDLDVATANLCYEEFPPLLNCRTEDEIYDQLKLTLNGEYREELGRQARQWIMKYHHWEKVIDKLIWHYETVLGRRVV